MACSRFDLSVSKYHQSNPIAVHFKKGAGVKDSLELVKGRWYEARTRFYYEFVFDDRLSTNISLLLWYRRDGIAPQPTSHHKSTPVAGESAQNQDDVSGSARHTKFEQIKGTPSRVYCMTPRPPIQRHKSTPGEQTGAAGKP